MIKSFSTCSKYISLALYGHLYQFLCGNLVGGSIKWYWVLGRFTRFYDPGCLEVQSQLELSLAQLSPSLLFSFVKTSFSRHFWTNLHFTKILTRYTLNLYCWPKTLFTLNHQLNLSPLCSPTGCLVCILCLQDMFKILFDEIGKIRK